MQSIFGTALIFLSSSFTILIANSLITTIMEKFVFSITLVAGIGLGCGLILFGIGATIAAFEYLVNEP